MSIDRLNAGRDAANDDSMSVMTEVKEELMDMDEKPDLASNTTFNKQLRRSSVNDHFRLSMVHIYSHARLKKELEERGMSTEGNRASCADRLSFALSGGPEPEPQARRKGSSKRKVEKKIAEVAIITSEILTQSAKQKASKRPSSALKEKKTKKLVAVKDNPKELEFTKTKKKTKKQPPSPVAPPPTPALSPDSTIDDEPMDDTNSLEADGPQLPRFDYAKTLPDVLFILVPPNFRCGEQTFSTSVHHMLYSWIKSLGSDQSVIMQTNFRSREGETVWDTINFYTSIVKREVLKQKSLPINKGKQIVLVGWRLSCYFNHRVLHSVAGVSAVINLAFPVKTQFGYRGGPDDNLLLTYCPTLFIVGDQAPHYNKTELQKLRTHMMCDTAVVTVPHGDGNLLVSDIELARHGITQFTVYKSIASDIVDFLNLQKDRGSPPPARPLSIMDNTPHVIIARTHFNELLARVHLSEVEESQPRSRNTSTPYPIAILRDKPQPAPMNIIPAFEDQTYRVVMNIPSVTKPPVPSHRNLFKDWPLPEKPPPDDGEASQHLCNDSESSASNM